MDPIHRILEAIVQTEGRCVLATIVHVEGSAYQREGTSMLFQEDGGRIGMLTAGCLEDDLAQRARDLFAKGLPQLVTYDLRSEDDLSWGNGAGCNGEIRILLEVVDDKMKKHLLALKRKLDSGTIVRVIKNVGGAFLGDYLFVAEEQPEDAFGEWRGDIADPAALRAAGLFVHRYFPKNRLLIFGAGSDAQPLSIFAKRIGFFVGVWDWRPAYCSHERFPEADQRWIGFPQDIAAKLSYRPDDAVVIMTHDFQKDKELLGYFKRLQLLYLGILGPRARTTRLLNGESIPGRIHSPAGMSIGARGPEEIAICIAADLIRHVRAYQQTRKPHTPDRCELHS